MRSSNNKYSRNNQDWLFFTPTLGDSWSHLVENECWKDSENRDKAQKEQVENKNKKSGSFKNNFLLLIVAFQLLLIGISVSLQISTQLETNNNSIVNNNPSKQ